MGEKMDSGIRLPGFKFQIYHFLPMYARLNIQVLLKLKNLGEVLTSKVMLIGSGALGKWVGGEQSPKWEVTPRNPSSLPYMRTQAPMNREAGSHQTLKLLALCSGPPSFQKYEKHISIIYKPLSATVCTATQIDYDPLWKYLFFSAHRTYKQTKDGTLLLH